MYVHASGSDLVQQGLPQMRLVPVHQRDRGAPSAGKAVAGTGCELEPASASPDDYELVWTTHAFWVTE
jgi:hypothetical protein